MNLDPNRFLVSKRILFYDQLMSRLIVFGGITVIVSVLGILCYMLIVTIPLFTGATAGPWNQQSIYPHQYTPLILHAQNQTLISLDPDNQQIILQEPEKEPTQHALPLPTNTPLKKVFFDAHNSHLITLDQNNQIQRCIINHNIENKISNLEITLSNPIEFHQAPLSQENIQHLSYNDSTDEKIAVLLLENSQHQQELWVSSFKQKRSLIGVGKLNFNNRENLALLIPNIKINKVLTPSSSKEIIVYTDSNEIIYFFRENNQWTVRQRFFTSNNLSTVDVALLYGDVSLLTLNNQGVVDVYSLYIQGDKRLFGKIRTIESKINQSTTLIPSPYSKGFIVHSKNQYALYQSTTSSLRHEDQTKNDIEKIFFSNHEGLLALIDKDHRLFLRTFDDPHKDAALNAFFSTVWYEGYDRPKYEWQSSSGSDDFEPKYSMVPLILGSLKGTFYALLFAIPLGVLAAIYVSQFLNPKLKQYIKPIIEIMASLPSVVLGFMAALWLAPLIEYYAPSVLIVLVVLPITALAAGYLSSFIPIEYKNKIPRGLEFCFLIPILALSLYAAWQSGIWIEQHFFTVQLNNEETIADFRLWWRQFSGLPYDQRNGLVVGFIMGFAVIPVIFTIAEDALSNVPQALIAAAEAMGASRWQVVRTVVIPVAAAGIFSSIMIGLGRAVGETMIVVMATGNTPIMDESGSFLFGEAGIGNGKFPIADHWNLFNGMRTLSANLAVELPEAVLNSTHYRTLYFGALLLFILTFTLNTLAELLRSRLRDKYKLV